MHLRGCCKESIRGRDEVVAIALLLQQFRGSMEPQGVRWRRLRERSSAPGKCNRPFLSGINASQVLKEKARFIAGILDGSANSAERRVDSWRLQIQICVSRRILNRSVPSSRSHRIAEGSRKVLVFFFSASLFFIVLLGLLSNYNNHEGAWLGCRTRSGFRRFKLGGR